jgi:hypothetical protein
VQLVAQSDLEFDEAGEFVLRHLARTLAFELLEGG